MEYEASVASESGRGEAMLTRSTSWSSWSSWTAAGRGERSEQGVMVVVVVGRKSLGGADWQRHAGGFRKERLQHECPNIACHWTPPLPLVASAHRCSASRAALRCLESSARCLVASVVQYSMRALIRSLPTHIHHPPSIFSRADSARPGKVLWLMMSRATRANLSRFYQPMQGHLPWVLSSDNL